VRNQAFLDIVSAAQPDAVAVVAFGRILGPRVLALPRLGCINVHASLLPLHRGAAPIQCAIMSGDPETGVTTMYMSEGLDEGDMLLVRRTPIGPEETSGSLGKRLSAMGAEALIETLRGLAQGSVTPEPQDPSLATYAAPLTPASGYLDFGRSAEELGWQIRGVHPWPGARVLLRGESVKIHTAVSRDGAAGAPGTVVAASPEGLDVATGRGLLRITRAQRPNRRALDIADLLRGWPIEPGEQLETP
jgi:methionyl-tRNA formyltransferase